MTLYYFEQRDFAGRWWPVKSKQEPVIKAGRLVRAESVGPRVRGVCKINSFNNGRSLDQLADLYGVREAA